MPTIPQRIVIGAIVLLAIVYASDDLYVRHRIAAHKQNDPLEVLVYPRILEIPEKGRHVEYALDVRSPTGSQSCVHSLFPHFGYDPCWYVRREIKKPIPMAAVPVIWRGPR